VFSTVWFPSTFLEIKPAFVLIAISISAAILRFFSRKILAFSRP